MRMARHERDHRETDAQAKDDIRAVMLLGDARAPKPKETEMIDKHPVTPRRGGEKTLPMDRPAPQAGVQVRERSGIWEVKFDGKFRGDYDRKEHALAAAALHELSPR